MLRWCWLSMSSVSVEIYSFSFKSTLSEIFPFSTCTCTLHDNLLSLMEYIPPRNHDFYKKLKHDNKDKKGLTNLNKLISEQVKGDAYNNTMDSDSEMNMALLESNLNKNVSKCFHFNQFVLCL